jgi:CO/xanthine dehydrogenase Mo-binding subunit
MQSVGRAVPRKEARSKVTGQARYVDDVVLPGMIHGVTVRSAVARGRIRGIRFQPGVPWDEITVVTAADIPRLSGGRGVNTISLILDDQPCLADGVIRHPEEPIALLAHPDRAIAERARELVAVDVEPLPPVLSIAESLARKVIVWGEDNVFK